MITGEIKSKVDQVWNAFWTGGISNPLTAAGYLTDHCLLASTNLLACGYGEQYSGVALG